MAIVKTDVYTLMTSRRRLRWHALNERVDLAHIHCERFL